MKEDQYKYDPNDIESLLMHKQFNELYEDEKEFVLQHVESEDEYNSLRNTLYELHESSSEMEWLEPDPSIRKAILKEFAQEKKGRFSIWLNSLFAFPEITWYRRPAFQLAFASVCIIGLTVFVVNRSNNDMATAENHTPENTISTPSEAAADSNLFAENIVANEFPPAPKVVDSSNEIVPLNTDVEVKSIEFYDVSGNADDAPMAAEPSISASAKEDLNEDVFVAKKEAASAKKIAEEKVVAMEMEKDQSKVVVATDANVSESSQMSAPVIANGSATLASSNATALTPSNVGGVQTYTWSVSANVQTSQPASEMKDVLGVLFTAY